jgi:hypothetical protein
MLKKIRKYVEQEPWERHLEEDKRALVIFSWIAIAFSIIWFAPTIVRILIWGPPK